MSELIFFHTGLGVPEFHVFGNDHYTRATLAILLPPVLFQPAYNSNATPLLEILTTGFGQAIPGLDVKIADFFPSFSVLFVVPIRSNGEMSDC
jgi:hypothetical protein